MAEVKAQSYAEGISAGRRTDMHKAGAEAGHGAVNNGSSRTFLLIQSRCWKRHQEKKYWHSLKLTEPVTAVGVGSTWYGVNLCYDYVSMYGCIL